MALPTLSAEQRAVALEKASETRRARAEMLAQLKAGTLGLSDVLARDDDMARKTRVAQVVKALPGYGSARAARLMAAAGVDEKRRVGGLGDKQRQHLIDAAS